MNVVFTCGGTAGHINPALAVANLLRERKPETKTRRNLPRSTACLPAAWTKPKRGIRRRRRTLRAA